MERIDDVYVRTDMQEKGRKKGEGRGWREGREREGGLVLSRSTLDLQCVLLFGLPPSRKEWTLPQGGGSSVTRLCFSIS